MRLLADEHEERNQFLRYGTAVASVALALAAYALLGPGVQQSPFSLFLAAIAFSALYGGLGPGLLATLLSSLAVTYFFLPPRFSFDLSDPSVPVRLAVFGFAALLINILSYGRSRAQASVDEQHARLHVTLASIGDAVIATGAEGKITFMNAMAEELTGWSQVDATGRSLEEVFVIVNEQTREPVESPVAKVLRQGTVVGLANHTVIISRTGVERPIDDSGAPIRERTGGITGVVLVFRDITERAQAEQERIKLLEQEQAARAEAEAARQRASFLAEASRVLASSLDYETTLASVARLAVPDVADWCTVDLLDAEGKLERLAVAHVDPAKVEWAHELQRKYPPDPSAPTGVYNVIRTGKAEFYPEISDELLVAAARDPEQLQIIRAIGFTSAITVPLVARERTLGAITLVSAESGRRFGEADVALAEDLARRAATAIDNAALYREAQAAVRARDQFVSIASHELKTPLTMLLATAQLLQRRAEREGNRSEQDLRSFAIVGEQSKRLNRLVTSLLDMSRIETGQLSIERQPVEIGALTNRLVDELRHTYPLYRIELTLPGVPLIIEGDELRLEQVVQNLVQNAVRYSSQGSPINVAVEEREGSVCISVADQGIGIPEAALPRLFTRFYRAPNVDQRNTAGMGIGLFVVKEIVTLHGGEVKVTSAEGQGSTFTVCFPLRQAHPAATPIAGPP